METIATAALVGFGTIIAIHLLNGGPMIAKLWLDYVFTGRGQWATVQNTNTSGSAAATGPVRV